MTTGSIDHSLTPYPGIWTSPAASCPADLWSWGSRSGPWYNVPSRRRSTLPFVFGESRLYPSASSPTYSSEITASYLDLLPRKDRFNRCSGSISTCRPNHRTVLEARSKTPPGTPMLALSLAFSTICQTARKNYPLNHEISTKPDRSTGSFSSSYSPLSRVALSPSPLGTHSFLSFDSIALSKKGVTFELVNLPFERTILSTEHGELFFISGVVATQKIEFLLVGRGEGTQT